MPNLDNIFNKFFPQSQTGSKGKFLLRMAWSVEILVALIGLCIGIIIIRGAQGVTEASDLMARGISLNDLTIGMIFIIVAVVELTKIPLATAVYYSVRLSWKIIFLIGLLLVNVSTFETIVTGFERINRERTKVVDKMIVEYNSIKTQIELINDNTNLPIIIYNIPSRCVIDMSVDTMARLYELKNIAGVKDATGDLNRLDETLKKLGSEFIQLTGEDGLAFEFNKRGGVGIISVTANIAPKLCSDFQKFSKSNSDNEIKEAERNDALLQPLHKALFIESNPAPVKYAAKLLGLCSDDVRLPLVKIQQSTKEKVKEALLSAKLL